MVLEGDHFAINPLGSTQPIGRLQLIKHLEVRNLPTQAIQAFALPTELEFHIASTGVQDLKGPTGNALAIPKKWPHNDLNHWSMPPA